MLQSKISGLQDIEITRLFTPFIVKLVFWLTFARDFVIFITVAEVFILGFENHGSFNEKRTFYLKMIFSLLCS